MGEMAYDALVSLAQTIDQILNHDQYYSISLHEKQQIISIHEHTTFFQAFLENSPEEASDSLEGRIRDLANQAEDIIEYCMSDKKRSQYGSVKKYANLAHGFHELKKITEKIDSTAREMDVVNRFRNKQVMQLGDSTVACSLSGIAPTAKDAMVGFDNHLMEIKSRLCGESSKLQIVPIFGMGGIGKTTLARNAYHDPFIMERFQIRAWVTLSQEYSFQQILSVLQDSAQQFNTERPDQSSDEQSKALTLEKVYKSFKGRRYLVVMDDMWSTNAWDDMKKIFPDDDNGSRIMLTTRLFDVAAYAESCSPLYEMCFMDVDKSWNLLRQKVFEQRQCPYKLHNIGKKIARSCRGLPLAIVVIAGVLSTVAQTEASWQKIAENVKLAFSENEDQFAKIFSLSYSHLPHHLKLCFLYMGIFPEDHEIHVSKLVKLWVAEGFVKPNGSKCFEEEAEECLAELVKRSLVFVNRRKFNGKIKSCSMHDLVRNLCIKKVEEEKFLLHVKDRHVGHFLQKAIKNQRRVSIHSDLDCLANINDSTIRTIICFEGSASSLESLGKFRLLRALDVVNVLVHSFRAKEYVSLPPPVFELFHLRYLAIYFVNEIPANISNLRNLQTLIVRALKEWSGYRACMLCLPREIWRMQQLRHLVSPFLDLPPGPEGATFTLENLQTLSAAANFICTERIMKMIPNLKKLGISYFGDEYDGDYHLHNLVHLHQLEKFKLKVYGGFPFRRKLNPVFPETLKKLSLSGWQLPWKDMTVVGSLPNLEVLKLRDDACQGSKWETTDGEFPQLKILVIEESDLEHWVTESSHFPNLKHLLLRRCWYLSEIPDGIGEIPTLELIEVADGKKSLADSAKWIQAEQQSYGNDDLRVLCKDIIDEPFQRVYWT